MLKTTSSLLGKSRINVNQQRYISWKTAKFDEKRKTNTVEVKWTGNGINFEGKDDQGSNKKLFWIFSKKKKKSLFCYFVFYIFFLFS